jgi:glycosyltransferase involved in cell wall biosynthesis
MIRVLWIVSSFPTDSNPMAGIFYKRIVASLAEKGIDVTVIAPCNSLKCNRKAGANIMVYRPFYFPFPTKLSLKIKAFVLFVSILLTIKINRIKFDIIDSRYAFPWCYISLKLSKIYKKPLISTFIGDDINTDIFESKKIMNFVKDIVFQSKIVTVSSELKEIVNRNFVPSNISVVYDGINFHELPAKQSKNEEKEKITIGFVGQLSRSKGCDILLDIIKLTKNKYRWIIIGDGQFREAFKGFSNIELPGIVEPEIVFRYYSQMDLFLFPSKKEGIPNVLKEAAFYEIPIIASALGGIVELTDNGRYAKLITDYDNSKGFIEAIDQYIENKNYFLYNAKKLKKYVIEKFDMETNVLKLISVYKDEYNKNN